MLIRGVVRGVVRGVARGVCEDKWGGPLPICGEPPSIEGTALAGETLAATPGTWSGETMPRSYQWYRDGVPIEGATDLNYVLVPEDAGALISVREYVSNASGTSSAVSEPVGPVGRAFDFSGGALPDGATLERASSGTRFNSSGVLVSETTDAARFDYDPATLDLLGLLVEPQRTNELVQSEAWTGWSNANAVGTTGAATSPDGAASAELLSLFDRATPNGYQISKNIGAVLSGTAVFSLFAKVTAASYQHVRIQISSDTAGAKYAGIDFVDGDISNSGTLAQWVEHLADGWTRIAIEAAISGTNQTVTIAGADPGNLASTFFASDPPGSLTFYAWGRQLEEGTFPTSYIPTSGSAVTRSADVLTLDVPDGDWDIEVTTPNGTFSASGLTVSGGAGYEFDWADFSGADTERHVLAATFTPA